MKSAYSLYCNTRGEGARLAVDWDWRIKEQWARSVQDEGPWQTEQGLDEESYNALLEHFGLGDWKSEFPIERIISMSPSELAAIRRQKETMFGLERREIISDTLGDHRPAEEFGEAGGLKLFLCEKEGEDGWERFLDISIKLSLGDWDIRREITLSGSEIEKLAAIEDRTLFEKELFSKFGVKDLRSFPGIPKGPYYWIDKEVIDAINHSV